MNLFNKYQYQWQTVSYLKKYLLLLSIAFLQTTYLYSATFYAKGISLSKVSFLVWILSSFQDISTAVHGFPFIYCLLLVILFKDHQINELIIQRFNSSKDIKLNKLMVIISNSLFFVLGIDFISIIFSYFPFGKFFSLTKEGDAFFFRNFNQHLLSNYSLAIQVAHSSALAFFYFVLLGLIFWGTTILVKKKSVGFIVNIIFIIMQAAIFRKQTKSSFISPINHYILYLNKNRAAAALFMYDLFYWLLLITVLTVIIWHLDNRKGVI
ncbi:MAG: hypothetical protein LBS28_00350 [Streptococcaceae bacterium]|jgi:hypothetical protein|nr:hypothetical protein [Streptococcaceae bacterium]